MEVFNAAFDFKFATLLEEETIGVSERDCKKYCKVSLRSPRRFLENMITQKYGHRVTNHIVPKIRKHFPRQKMFYYTATDDPEDEDSIIYQYYKGNIDLRKFNNKSFRRKNFDMNFRQVRKLRIDELKRCVTSLELIDDEEYPWAIFCRVISRRSPIIYPNKEEFEVMLDNIHVYKGWVRKALERANSEIDYESEEEESEEEEEDKMIGFDATEIVEQEVPHHLDPPWFDPDDVDSVNRFIVVHGPTISYDAFLRLCAVNVVNARLREAMAVLISDSNATFMRDFQDDVVSLHEASSFYDPDFLLDSDEDF